MLSNILIPLALFGGLGVAVDFLLGKKGQDKVKDWLLARWVKFDDVKWSSFSEKEAGYFIWLFDRIFGAQLLSWRRLIACAVTTASCILGFSAFSAILRSSPLGIALFGTWPLSVDALAFEILSFVTTIFALMFSLSYTRWISSVAVYVSMRWAKGPFVFLLLLLLHLVLLVSWQPLVSYFVMTVANLPQSLHAKGDWNNLTWVSFRLMLDSLCRLLAALSDGAITIRDAFGLLNHLFERELSVAVNPALPAVFTIHLWMAYFANAFRIFIAIGLFLMFVFRRWIAGFCSLVWRRILEDSKGPFTLVLGGIGAFAGAVKELISKL